MTEAEWLTCTEPGRMLDVVQASAPDRPLIHFAVACWTTPEWYDAEWLDVIYTVADDVLAGKTPLARLVCQFGAFDFRRSPPTAGWWVRAVAREQADTVPAKPEQARLLREMFGNPFRPSAVDPAWRTSSVVELARSIHRTRSFDLLPILADALEDAGCDVTDLLSHCRSGGAHARGCWAVEAVLGEA